MPPVLLNRMMDTGQILLILKYVIGVLIIIAIFFAPAWLARQKNRKIIQSKLMHDQMLSLLLADQF